MIECDICYTDEAILLEALADIGVALEMLEIHSEPKDLEAWGGKTMPQKAHIIIRRKHIGSDSNDIGFEKTNGIYKAIISDFDKRREMGQKILSGELDQHYAKRMILKTIAATYGHSLTSYQMIDGTIEIKIAVR